MDSFNSFPSSSNIHTGILNGTGLPLVLVCVLRVRVRDLLWDLLLVQLSVGLKWFDLHYDGISYIPHKKEAVFLVVGFKKFPCLTFEHHVIFW